MAFSMLQVSFLQITTHNQHTDTPTPPRPSSTHTTQTTADGFLIHLTTSHHFRFRSSGNPAFSCPPHFWVLSLIHSLSLSPIILHTSHTLFCREVHNPNSRSRCGLAGKRTQNLRAILLLLSHKHTHTHSHTNAHTHHCPMLLLTIVPPCGATMVNPPGIRGPRGPQSTGGHFTNPDYFQHCEKHFIEQFTEFSPR